MERKLSILFVCIALSQWASACTDGSDRTDRPETDAKPAEFSTVHQALFGENGGEPWSESGSIAMTSEITDGHFGLSIAAGEFHGSGNGTALLIGHSSRISSQGRERPVHGHVDIRWLNGGKLEATSSVLERTSGGNDSFGRVVLAGNYCSKLNSAAYHLGDIGIISMPTADYAAKNETRNGGVVLYGKIKSGNKYAWKRISELYGAAGSLTGQNIAVGDVDGDGADDLIYVTYDQNTYSSSLNVALNFCTATTGYLRKDASLRDDEFQSDLPQTDQNLASKLYVRDLDGSGTPEIIIVASNYYHSMSDYHPSGVVYFYRFQNGSLVQSRPPVYGEYDSSKQTGSNLSDVAFVDLDGDGKEDILVGEPGYSTDFLYGGRIRSFINAGIGNAFKASDVINLKGNSQMRKFGTRLVIDDVNADGYPDLIVGASGGKRNNTQRSPGYVYVFVGTKDGSIFSKDPYWSYTAAETNTSLFGENLLVLDGDGAGWKDIVVTSPGQEMNDGLYYGQDTKVFFSNGSPCYTADKCMVMKNGKEVCYAANELEQGNLCNYCDPTKANFDFQPVTCEAVSITDEACQKVPADSCQPQTGCPVAENLPDGTECGTARCSRTTQYAVRQICQSGFCTEEREDCSDYKCSTKSGAVACLTSCTSDSDCFGSGLYCKAGECTTNNLPETTIYPTDATVVQGEAVKFDVIARDSDGDVPTVSCDFLGNAPDGSLTVLSQTSGTGETYVQYQFAASNSAVPGNYGFLCTVSDGYSDPVSVSSNLTVEEADFPPIAIAEPSSVILKQGETYAYFDASKSTDDHKLVKYTWTCENYEFGTFDHYQSPKTSFTVNPTTVPGDYTVILTVSDGVNDPQKDYIKVTVIEGDKPSKPVITSPADGDSVYLVTVSGVFEDPGEMNGTVVVTENGKVLCSTTITEATWSCTITDLAAGEHTLNAVHKDGTLESEASSVHFTVVDVAAPIITSPKDGEVVGTYPQIDGTVAAGEGEITVWISTPGSSKSTRLCSATSNADGDWTCIPEKAVAEGSYIIRVTYAYMDRESGFSDPVNIVVEDQVTAEDVIRITNPKDGSYINSYYGFIVTGVAELSTGSIVNVTMSSEELTFASCSTIVDLDGTWMCDMHAEMSYPEGLVLDGGYTITATTTYDSKEYQASVDVIAVNTPPANNDEAGHNSRGGMSCSAMLTQPTSISAWWIAIAAFGFVLVPRRRRNK